MSKPITGTTSEPCLVVDVCIIAAVGMGDEAEHVARFANVIDGVTLAIGRHGGTSVQVRRDGVTGLFAPDAAHHGINAAIDIQEQRKLALATRHPRLGAGVASGPVRRVGADRTPEGAVVERARRLAVAANDGAVLVDLNTITTTPLHQIRSVVGRAEAREAAAYLSEEGWLPGPSGAVRYHEVLWDITTHGLRPDALTSMPTGNVDTDDEAGADGEQVSAWKLGRLRNWNRERRHGFIVSDDGEFFYVDDRFLACDDVPPLGAEVWFRPRPSLIEGKNRVAAMVMTVGGTTGASIDHQRAEIRDQAGNTGTLAYLGSGRDDGRALRVGIDGGRPIVT